MTPHKSTPAASNCSLLHWHSQHTLLVSTPVNGQRCPRNSCAQSTLTVAQAVTAYMQSLAISFKATVNMKGLSPFLHMAWSYQRLGQAKGQLTY